MWNRYYPQAKIECEMPNYNLLALDYKEENKQKETQEKILRKRIGFGKRK